MPSSTRSFAAVFAHAHRPVRAMLESASVGIGSFTPQEAMQQMRPHAGLPEMRQRGSHEPDRGQQVRVHGGLQRGVVDLERSRRWRAARVRDENVEPAEALHRRVDELLRRLGLGDVRDDRERLARHLALRVAQGLLSSRADHDLRALAGERERRRAARGPSKTP